MKIECRYHDGREAATEWHRHGYGGVAEGGTRVPESRDFGVRLVFPGGYVQDSDVDLVITFGAEASISLFDVMELEDRHREIIGRPVDIVDPNFLANPLRRRSMLASTERLYSGYRSSVTGDA